MVNDIQRGLMLVYQIESSNREIQQHQKCWNAPIISQVTVGAIETGVTTSAHYITSEMLENMQEKIITD